MRRRPSRLFVSALAGLGITAAGLLSGSRWPLWPAGRILDLLRIADPYGDTAGLARALVFGLLIAVNSAVWAAAVFVLMAVASVERSADAPRD